MSFSDNARTRAAASSIASGRPSRRWQISATTSPLAGFTVNPSRTAAARSANSVTASEPPSGGTGMTTSPARPSHSRLVARIRSSGQFCSSAADSAATASTRCSELSSTSSSRRGSR